jgi:hypothetical protein
MLKRPEGLFPSQQRRAELHAVLAPEVATVVGALGETPGADEDLGGDAGEAVP